MNRPAVAVRVGEEAEAAPRVILDLGDVDAVIAQERMDLDGILDVHLNFFE